MIAHHVSASTEEDASDETLVDRVRAGDDGAFEELYRRHSRVAVATARKVLRSPQDSEDAAAEAFANVLSALRKQVGPRETFRPYLLACVRNCCAMRIRQRSRQDCTRDRVFADIAVSQDDQVVDSAVAAAAFRAIPTRWQSALWMAEVEHLDPSVIATRLDVNVPAAAALVYRARQGFTEAFLAQHLRCSGQPSCVVLGPKLAQYVRGTAGTMAARQVEAHVAECASCAAALRELADLNSSLRSIPAPLSIAAAAGATAAVASGSGLTMTATGLGLGWLAKAVAIAALSATPLLVADEVSKPVAGARAEASSSSAAQPRTSNDEPVVPRAFDPTKHVADDPAGPAVHDSSARDAIPPSTDPPSQSSPTTAGAADAQPVPPGAGNIDVGPVLSTLPTIPGVSLPIDPVTVLGITVTVPTIPPIALGEPLPTVQLPTVSLPSVSLPPIPSEVSLPGVTVPLPPVSVPPVSLPPVGPVSVPVVSLPVLGGGGGSGHP